MATNGMYDLAREKFALGEFDFASDTFKFVLVNTASYTVDLEADEFLSDIPEAMRISISGSLGTKTTEAGVLGAASPIVFSTVTGDQSEALVLIRWVSSAADSELIAYFETGLGLPITPNGNDITLTLNASGILKL